jgi:hypothetical protein
MNVIHQFIDRVSAAFGARWLQFFVLPALVLAWLFDTDYAGGADTVLRLQVWGYGLLITVFAYGVGKALLDRVVDSKQLYAAVLEGNIGAAVVLAGVMLLRALVLIGLLMFFAVSMK